VIEPDAPPIRDFSGLIAVVTGGGTGMGRALTTQLAAEGCRVAICDVSGEHMDDTIAEAGAVAHDGVRLATFVADVADADAMEAFAAHVATTFRTDHVNLLFNNAGIGGGGSIVLGDRDEWDRVFGVCWGGVLNGMRSFLPMLLASDRGHVINTSSVNGLWACLGPAGAHTAYSAAKFAVRGLTEALIVDFRVNAPHLTASVVMPGHIGTQIARNSMAEFGRDPKNLDAEQVEEIRDLLARRGIDASDASDEDIRNLMTMRVESFENEAPTTAAGAATLILQGVRSGDWRILIGPDAADLDELLRARPRDAYTEDFMDDLSAMGHFEGLIQR
jgi:NAD(P)-dependent dehydrogenase (short-subunit alcohol dehydrogenase family)